MGDESQGGHQASCSHVWGQGLPLAALALPHYMDELLKDPKIC